MWVDAEIRYARIKSYSQFLDYYRRLFPFSGKRIYKYYVVLHVYGSLCKIGMNFDYDDGTLRLSSKKIVCEFYEENFI